MNAVFGQPSGSVHCTAIQAQCNVKVSERLIVLASQTVDIHEQPSVFDAVFQQGKAVGQTVEQEECSCILTVFCHGKGFYVIALRLVCCAICRKSRQNE